MVPRPEEKKCRGGGSWLRRMQCLPPFFLFGAAIERVGDQVVDTCLASRFDSSDLFPPPRPAELEIVWHFLLDCWNLPNPIPNPRVYVPFESLFHWNHLSIFSCDLGWNGRDRVESKARHLDRQFLFTLYPSVVDSLRNFCDYWRFLIFLFLIGIVGIDCLHCFDNMTRYFI